MLQKISADIKNLQVLWKGENKNDKTGKVSPVMQAANVLPDGRMDTLYITGGDDIKKISVGDRINATLSIRAWKDNLYLFLTGYQLAEIDKGKVKL